MRLKIHDVTLRAFSKSLYKGVVNLGTGQACFDKYETTSWLNELRLSTCIKCFAPSISTRVVLGMSSLTKNPRSLCDPGFFVNSELIRPIKASVLSGVLSETLLVALEYR